MSDLSTDSSRRPGPRCGRVLSFTIRIAAVLITAVLSIPAAHAATPDTELLTLDRALELARGANRDLAAAKSMSDAASAEARAAEAERLPKVLFEAGVMETDNPTLVFSNKLGQQNFTAQDFAIDRLNEPDSLTNWHGRLTVEQPLWTGGRLSSGIDAARAAGDAAAAEAEGAAHRVAHATIDAWTGAVVAAHGVEVAREALETARAHLRTVRDLHAAGLVVASDPLQAEVRVSEVEEMLVRAEADAAVARAGLARVLGLDYTATFELPSDLPATGSDLAADVEQMDADAEERLIVQALDVRPDLRAAQRAATAAAHLADLARAARMPEVAAQAFVESNAADPLTSDGENWGVAVALRLDLFDAGRRPRQDAAAHRRAAAAAQAASQAQAVAVDVRRAVHGLRAAHRRVTLAGHAVELAAQSLTIVRDRYENGLAIVTELLDAETGLTRSRLRRLAAERDLLLARAGLDLAVGRDLFSRDLFSTTDSSVSNPSTTASSTARGVDR